MENGKISIKIGGTGKFIFEFFPGLEIQKIPAAAKSIIWCSSCFISARNWESSEVNFSSNFTGI